jgi:LPS sulfotransferase NodH
VPDIDIRLSYLICATPRTGSNFLCEVLDSTGVAGRPDEYFWNRPYWLERWQVAEFPEFMARVLREGTTPNRVFGSKLMRDQLKEIVPELAQLYGCSQGDHHSVLQMAFPNLQYVWLRRRDKVRQGISFYRALETNVWRSTDLARVGPVREPTFNFEAIKNLVELSRWADDDWQEFFISNALEPLEVAYEDLAQSPETVATRILEHLGVQASAAVQCAQWQHQHQADALTEAWSDLYAQQALLQSGVARWP